jgi:Fe-S-cluster containining protein
MVKFECQENCGKCCTARGDYEYVWLTMNDILRFAAYFKITVHRFVTMYCAAEKGGGIRLNPKGTCQFLEGTKCSVHEARPEQCRKYPFSEIFNTFRWEDAQKTCPGIGKGREYSEDEVVDIIIGEDK